MNNVKLTICCRYDIVLTMTQNTSHTPAGAAFTDLVLEVFRLNGQLLSSGDHLVQGEGLTSARWQVLGAIELAGRPMTVAQVGRRMGISRQAVQRVANDLQATGFLDFSSNPDHKRAPLLALSAKAKRSLKHVGEVQAAWANALVEGLDSEQLATTAEMLRELQVRIETTRSANSSIKAS